jgi:hypothetical protein
MKRKIGEGDGSDTPPAEGHPDIPPSVHSKGEAPEAGKDLASDFLKAEYNALVELYTHTEDALSSTFNFYLTLLSVVVGAILVVAQIPSMSDAAALATLGLLLIFAILLNAIT